jgi:hypothetical protein
MSNKHTCHWPGCELEVPPAMWGCKQHWFMLPKPLRDAVWREYRPGQEKDKMPSVRYLIVAQMVQAWISGELTIHGDGTVTSTIPELQRHLSAANAKAKGQ